MEKIYEEIYNKNKKLIDIAIEKTKKLDDDLLHFIGHTHDVIDYIKELLENYEANKEVCIIAAYWHDVGRVVVDEGHEEKSGEMLKKEMQKLGYEDEMIEQCYLAVVNHKRSSNPPTIEAKIVRDADKIAYIGKRRWRNCIEQDYTALDEIIEKYLYVLKEKILKLDYSKELFDRDMNLYIRDYLKIIEDKKNGTC